MGFVGLSTALGFASKNIQVHYFDNNPKKMQLLTKSKSPFYEPQIEENLKKANKNNMLKKTTGIEEAVLNSDIIFLTVGTPSNKDGSINLNYIHNAVAEIGTALKKAKTYKLIVIKSTVVPNTTNTTIKSILEEKSDNKCGPDFGLCMNPEFLKEGSALNDTLNPDRIIIGEFDEKSGNILKLLYQDFYSPNVPPIIKTNLSTAELIKYANNCFLATKISFINTFANICEKIPGADIKDIAKAIGLDDRINPKFLRAGLGYGGSCFPKDLKALIAYSKQNEYSPTLLDAVEKVNQQQTSHVVDFIEKELGDLKNKKIAILGLSFKPKTNDMRESRAIPIIEKLIDKHSKVQVYDPKAMVEAKKIFENKIKYTKSSIDCLKEADCCILATEWPEFDKLTPQDYIKQMNTSFLIDGRRMYNPKKFRLLHNFVAIGLGPQKNK